MNVGCGCVVRDRTMEKTHTEAKASALPVEKREQETAILNCRVKRQPASLGRYYYHIEPGKLVYIHSFYTLKDGTECAIVAAQPDAECVSEDYFRVRVSSLLKAGSIL